MKKFAFHLLIMSFPFLFFLQKTDPQIIKSGSMTLAYEVQQDSLWLQLKAPTTGWLAVGFNGKNDIVGSDLLMFSVRKGLVFYEDQYVQAPRQHPADWELGVGSSIRMIEGTEAKGWTSVTFKIPLKAGDQYDFDHQEGKAFWLIMAYAFHDDFDHHSIMRKHRRYTWIFNNQKP